MINSLILTSAPSDKANHPQSQPRPPTGPLPYLEENMGRVLETIRLRVRMIKAPALNRA